MNTPLHISASVLASLDYDVDGDTLSVIHDDGQVRVSMMSQEDAGKIMLVNPDLKAAVKLSTQGQHGVGFITVNHANGKAAVIISALPEHGCVILNDSDGQIKYMVPDPKNI